MKRPEQIEGMSGKPEGPKPQPPKLFKGKLKVTLALEPKVEVPQTADLTVLPSNAAAVAEDRGPAPRYEGIAERRGMFGRAALPGAVQASARAAPTAAPRRKATAAERLAQPLLGGPEEEEEAALEAAALEAAPAPPPLVKAGPAVLPPVAKSYLREPKPIAPEPLSYENAAVKKRISDEMADTLLELEEQLEGLKIVGLNLDEGTGFTAEGEPVDGRTTYVFDNEQELEAGPRMSEARLKSLDTLFPSLRIRMNAVLGEGALQPGSTDPIARDYQVLLRLFSFAKTYKQKAEKEAAKQGAKAEAVEAARTKTLEGTPYEDLAEPIQEEKAKAPYEITTDSSYTPGTYPDRKKKNSTIPVQKGFIPQTRRAFSYFIFDKYKRYMLKALEKLDPNACKALGDSSSAQQIYAYQKFVRDYISYMTPYRGVLVYHGLGSGKTCTAIAASEALLSTGGKKRIIVLTPFSLRKNFIQQITFCGFRHFRLMNYWTPHEYKASDGQNALWLFATSVLQIPVSYLTPGRGKSMRIWIPDLNKAPGEENYSKLGGAEQAEIRNQIYETLVYDPYKKKDGLIWFISYNGIPASKLLDIACRRTKDTFDDSVIVVDEIHNLIRLMQGVIDPYLQKITKGDRQAEAMGDAKYLDPDRITSGVWKPKYCSGTMGYKRGYLFYRLLTEAKNSKLIGLSGTPLINFPEELGILANVLHGNNLIYTASLPKIMEAKGNETIVEGLKALGEGNDPEAVCLDFDFYDVQLDDLNKKIVFTFTFLPEGYRKIPGQLGVERIPIGEPLEPVDEKLKKVRACINTVLKRVNPKYSFGDENKFKEVVEPLLPVLGEPTEAEAKQKDDSFKGRFVAPDGVSLINEHVLLKRLTGLISYYKGNRKDLMPEVKEDTIVRVPMSLDQQRKYIAIRLAEIEVEEKKAKGKGAAPKGDDAELAKLSSSQNYRMASRQACNFVFPDGFTRPRPRTAEEAKAADEFGGSAENLGGEDQATEASALEGTPEEEARIEREEEAARQLAAAEEEAVSRRQEEEEIAAKRAELAGKTPAEIEAAVKEIQDRYAEQRRGGLVLAAQVEEPAEPSAAVSTQQERCLANLLRGETYQDALDRSKECLLDFGKPKLALVDASDPSKPSPLGRWSPKYKAILEKIDELPGSSLVYSQFLGMEGIGIFTIVMQANGYTPIKIVSRGGQFAFDEKTEASFRKGPASGDKRFILFTGGEDSEVRKANIDIFNAKLGELSPPLRKVLEESGFTDEVGNKKGELCRVFCITAAGAEGLSLKNVRGVHIMEPYWNDVRMAQVKGRAVRICSHQELPLKERNVSIFTYISVFDRLAQESLGDPRENERMKWAIPQEIWLRDSLDRATAQSYGLVVSAVKGEYAMTSDERLFFISERKKKLVENLTVVMKTAAADCTLNYKENRDGTFICRLLGNEGDFLYHPILQKDIETSGKDNLGDIFKIPAEELAKVREAESKLRFEGEEEEAEPVVRPSEQGRAAVGEAAPVVRPSDQGRAAAGEPEPSAPPPPPPPPPKPAAPVKPFVAKIKYGPKEYAIRGVPDSTGKISQFLIYELEDKTFAKPIGTIQSEFNPERKQWIPKKGTIDMTPPRQ